MLRPCSNPSVVLDLHNHVLFGLDDGCRTPEESTALAQAMKAAGHQGVVATPHIRPGIFDNDPQGIRERFAETKEIVEGAGLQFGLGAEYYFDENLLQAARKKELLTLGQSSRYVLTEFPLRQAPLRWQDVIFEIRLAGYVPVIAHPERCKPIAERLEESLRDFRQAGALLQLDMGSLIGHYGSYAKKAATQLVKLKAYHLAAFDLHRPEDVKKIVEKSKKTLFKLLKKRKAETHLSVLLEENPRRLVSNQPPEEIVAI